MNLKNSYRQRKLLSPEDDWDLIYREALAARKALYEAKNQAQIKLEQLSTSSGLFGLISILLWMAGVLPTIREYVESPNRPEYFYLGTSLIAISGIFFFFAFDSIRTQKNLQKEIAVAEKILDELEHELFSTDQSDKSGID